MPKPAELEAQLAQQLRSVQAQAAQLVGAVNKDGAGPTTEQQSQLQRLMQSLKQIEEQQKELQAAIQTAKAEKEEMLERDRDFYDPKAKDLPPPKMEELRDNNTIQMDEDDMARRKDDAHKARKKFIPSGGLAGFRVASDLAKMDFGAAEESD
ncbi:hypothetical protein WJX79_005561 [Trebouxia sp. C0005]